MLLYRVSVLGSQVSTGVGALLSITDRWPKTATVGARSDQRRMAELGPVAPCGQLGPQMRLFIAVILQNSASEFLNMKM